MIVLFACLDGWLKSSHVEKEIKARSLKKTAWAGVNTGHAHASACALTSATILGTLCISV